MVFEEGISKEVWHRIKSDNQLRLFADKVREAADNYLKKPIPECTYELFSLFHKTGNREKYQRVYFKRRAMLDAFAFMVKYSGEDKYINALENIIWSICGEYTWALPAHLKENCPAQEAKTRLDLFCCETAFALSEILWVCGESLAQNVKKRIEYEVRARVINPYLKCFSKSEWEKMPNNWAAVCGASVGASILYLGTEHEKEEAIKRIDNVMHVYLSGFGEDGACEEGYGYWIYGFGFFTYYAQLLRQYTKGKIDYFKIPKVQSIAQFQQKIILYNDRAVNFSDCCERVKHHMGLSGFLAEEYCNAEGNSLKFAIMFGDDECYRWPGFIRDFVWYKCADNENSELKSTYYLENVQWYIKKNENYYFAAKGGNNGESHNHNDLGTFILDNGYTSIAADLGCGEYTKEYFGNGRYDIFVNNSFSHNVPIINGKGQEAGSEYFALVLSHGEDEFVLDIKNAYNIATLSKARRKFKFYKNYIIIEDEFEFSKPDNYVTERIVSHIQTKIPEHNGIEAKCHYVDYSDHYAEIRRAFITDIIYRTEGNYIKSRIKLDI